MNEPSKKKRKQSKPIRIEVVLLALCFGLLFMIPSFVCLELLPAPWGYIACGVNLPFAYLLAILLVNKLPTGKFTDKGNLSFGNNG